MSQSVILSGIQPTGPLHIGNYLGAVRNWLSLQESGDYECFFSIVDLHSLTGDMSASERHNAIITLAAELIAAGIDPDKATLFVQSHVPEHTELAWVFNCVTPVAELERMTQFKDKSARQAQNINTGLLTYPTLMAADILLYRATHVPVGEDQIQHLELTRSVARWFTNRFGEFFAAPEALLTDIPRVKSLLEPTKKMSKSLGQGHVLDLADEPEVIEKKIKKAVTATEGGGAAPGVENLLLLLNAFGTDTDLYNDFVQAEKDGSIKYGDLKSAVCGAVANHFKEFRAKRDKLLANPGEIAEILATGAERARARAMDTMDKVRELVGIR